MLAYNSSIISGNEMLIYIYKAFEYIWKTSQKLKTPWKNSNQSDETIEIIDKQSNAKKKKQAETWSLYNITHVLQLKCFGWY